MPVINLALSIDAPDLGAVSWSELESLAVQMSKDIPGLALAEALDELQERLIDQVCGPKWAPRRGLPAPFACPGCRAGEDFARKGRRTRPRRFDTAAGRVEVRLWHVGCRSCGKVFAPLLELMDLHGKRRTDRLTLDLAELAAQMSFEPPRWPVSFRVGKRPAAARTSRWPRSPACSLPTGPWGQRSPALMS